MRNESKTLQTLTRTLANNINPSLMRLADLDQLHSAISKAIASEPSSIDLLTLDQLANDLDAYRRNRRLGQTGHVTGQLDFNGNEVAA